MKCEVCFAQNAPEALFCGTCGQPLRAMPKDGERVPVISDGQRTILMCEGREGKRGTHGTAA